MDTDRPDRSDLDAKTDVGPGTGRGVTAHSPELAKFDREINLRGVLWSSAILVLIALVVHLLIWWLLRGFETFEEKRDVRLTPIEDEMRPQEQPPPEPRLEVAASENLRQLRLEEETLIRGAGWVNQQQGVVRVPLDLAMEVIAARGVAAQVVGGTGSAAHGHGAPAESHGAAVEPPSPPSGGHVGPPLQTPGPKVAAGLRARRQGVRSRAQTDGGPQR